MKNKIKITIMLLVIIIILSGCSKYPFSQQKYDEQSLFKRIDIKEYKSDEVYEHLNISIDKETGVNYIIISGVIKGRFYFGITPRYNSDGDIIVTPIN